MRDILEIIKHPKESDFLVKGARKIIENEAKEQKGGFPRLLLGTLGTSLIANILAGKGFIRAGARASATSRWWGTIRAGQDF